MSMYVQFSLVLSSLIWYAGIEHRAHMKDARFAQFSLVSYAVIEHRAHMKHVRLVWFSLVQHADIVHRAHICKHVADVRIFTSMISCAYITYIAQFSFVLFGMLYTHVRLVVRIKGKYPGGGYMALELFVVSARTNKRHRHLSTCSRK